MGTGKHKTKMRLDEAELKSRLKSFIVCCYFAQCVIELRVCANGLALEEMTLTWLMIFSWLSTSSSRGSAVGCWTPPSALTTAASLPGDCCSPPRRLSAVAAVRASLPGLSWSGTPVNRIFSCGGSALFSAPRTPILLIAQLKISSDQSLRNISPQRQLTMNQTLNEQTVSGGIIIR